MEPCNVEPSDPSGVRIEIRGLVQGVGFRPWVYTLARAAALRGRVWNHSSGVTVEAFGDSEILRAFVDELGRPPMPAARVRDLSYQPIPAEEADSFEIVASHAGEAARPSIPPDLATCDDCLRELGDAADRRHRYAFVNCTSCGPRYTICLDVPYDRPATTMAAFPMCEQCRREYEEPRDRRFHAQPNACPRCGPQLRLVDRAGDPVAGDPIAVAARLLREGRILAVKGMGGYHLACDAAGREAVAALRARKHRDAKPFAVMVPSLDWVDLVGRPTRAERDLLAEVSRPIVLVRRRPGGGLPDEVAPGNPLVGLMLPYTPLHELLLAAVDRPLVMTSGNRSDEPMACDDSEAVQRLAEIADFFLQHDRAIANRCDDSVARVIAGRPVLLRRGRGWVPGSLRLSGEVPRPVLAVGAHLKNAFCLAAGDLAWLGPHVGDLETHEACAAFESMVERFQRFVGIEPEVVAHDLHPDYFTTGWAERRGLARIAVQHHHAHIASAMAEHGIEGPVIGLAWDGTGYGTDGTAWGGELLVADRAGFRRLATFRPLPLAGGDRAIVEVWRIALALLDDAFDGDPPLERLRLFDGIDPVRVASVRRMIASGLRAPLAHGVGRYFDAFGALAPASGGVALRGRGGDAAGLRRRLGRTPPLSVRSRPWSRRTSGRGRPAAGGARRGRRSPRRKVGGDHLRPLPRHTGRRRGRDGAASLRATPAGCRSSSPAGASRMPGWWRISWRRCSAGLRVCVHSLVPPNDGGIALGQAVVAAARLRGAASTAGEV